MCVCVCVCVCVYVYVYVCVCVYVYVYMCVYVCLCICVCVHVCVYVCVCTQIFNLLLLTFGSGLYNFINTNFISVCASLIEKGILYMTYYMIIWWHDYMTLLNRERARWTSVFRIWKQADLVLSGIRPMSHGGNCLAIWGPLHWSQGWCESTCRRLDCLASSLTAQNIMGCVRVSSQHSEMPHGVTGVWGRPVTFDTALQTVNLTGVCWGNQGALDTDGHSGVCTIWLQAALKSSTEFEAGLNS